MNFGFGKFAYLAEPLPCPLQALRVALYEALVPVANAQRLGPSSGVLAPRLEMFRAEVFPKVLALEAYPPGLAEFWELCRAGSPSQRLPTSICLRPGEKGLRGMGGTAPRAGWSHIGTSKEPFEAILVL